MKIGVKNGQTTNITDPLKQVTTMFPTTKATSLKTNKVGLVAAIVNST